MSERTDLTVLLRRAMPILAVFGDVDARAAVLALDSWHVDKIDDDECMGYRGSMSRWRGVAPDDDVVGELEPGKNGP